MEKQDSRPKKRKPWTDNETRTFYVVGALIVFTTFLVKDALHEYLKDKNDVISEAQGEYRAVRNLSIVDKHVVDLAYLVRELEHRLKPISEFQAGTSTPEWAALELTEVNLESITRLSAQLENAHKYEAKMNERKSDLKLLRQRIQEFWLKSEERKGKSLEDADISHLGELENGVWSNYWDLQPLGDQVFVEASQLKSQREHRYRIATWVSYFLYAIGWTLGPVGHLTKLGSGTNPDKPTVAALKRIGPWPRQQ